MLHLWQNRSLRLHCNAQYLTDPKISKKTKRTRNTTLPYGQGFCSLCDEAKCPVASHSSASCDLTCKQRTYSLSIRAEYLIWRASPLGIAIFEDLCGWLFASAFFCVNSSRATVRGSLKRAGPVPMIWWSNSVCIGYWVIMHSQQWDCLI